MCHLGIYIVLLLLVLLILLTHNLFLNVLNEKEDHIKISPTLQVVKNLLYLIFLRLLKIILIDVH